LIVAVVNLKGGVGKSTTAIYFATVASEGGEGGVVLDADTEKSATEWAAAGELPFEVVPAERDRLARQARALAKGGRTVVIDTPPNDREVLRAAAAVADRVVVPVAPTGVDVNRLRATLEVLLDVEATRGTSTPASSCRVGTDARSSPGRPRSSSGASRCSGPGYALSPATRTGSGAAPPTWRNTKALGRRSSVANGKKKRSLREAFSTVSAPEEKSGAAPPSGEKPSGGWSRRRAPNLRCLTWKRRRRRPLPVRRAARARTATHPVAALVLEEEARTEGIPVIL
jgi:hypothetical protein